MIDVLHWLSCFVVLSVVLAQLEAIKITATGAMRLLVRALGWSMLGLSAFNGILEPFFRDTYLPHHIGMIGIALLALSYGWQGATKRTPHRRGTDHVRDR